MDGNFCSRKIKKFLRLKKSLNFLSLIPKICPIKTFPPLSLARRSSCCGLTRPHNEHSNNKREYRGERVERKSISGITQWVLLRRSFRYEWEQALLC